MSSLKSKYEFVYTNEWCVVCKRGNHQTCKGKYRLQNTGKNVFFVQGEQGEEIAKDAGGFYVNTIMEYLDSAGVLQS